MKVLDELERLEQAATPGPWHSVRNGGLPLSVCRPDQREIIFTAEYFVYKGIDQEWRHTRGPDLDLIAQSRNALPALIRVAQAADAMVKWDTRWEAWHNGDPGVAQPDHTEYQKSYQLMREALQELESLSQESRGDRE